MKSCSLYVLATIMSLSAASFASAQTQTQTQTNAAREAMIHKCILQAVSEYPRGPDSNDSARTALYKSCMAAAGLAP